MRMPDARAVGRWAYRAGYGVLRPLLFRKTPEAAHQTALRMLGYLDHAPFIPRVMGWCVRTPAPVTVGGVVLESPVMVAAGLVKGRGFASEEDALGAVRSGEGIMPGWRSVPLMCGAVEFGSFTRWPRMGNTGRILWRDVATHSTQNRIGLRNPGARAAAEYLRDKPLPAVFGISLATTPGVDDPQQQRDEVCQAARFFVEAGVRPSWVTLNLSCPNTEADPRGQQSEQLAQILCSGMKEAVRDIPLWVKIGPDLGAAQIEALAHAFDAAGVKAVIATNTLSTPAPDQVGVTAGLAGGRLREHALDVARQLHAVRTAHSLRFDIVGCGGGLDGASVQAYTLAGAQAVQLWSALVFRGPLAPALIAAEWAEREKGRKTNR